MFTKRSMSTLPLSAEETLRLEREWTAADGAIARQVTAVVVGAGDRGQNYATFALDYPARLKVADHVT
jgi:hypothetical protein